MKQIANCNYNTAVNTSLKMLGIRSYSEQEIRSKLVHKGYDEDIIEKVIAYLKNRRYINDMLLCQNLYDEMLASGKYGIRAICFRLKKRGISDFLVNDVVCVGDLDNEYNAALQLVRKKFSGNIDDIKPRIARFLASRGFAYSTISKVLNSFSCSDFE